MFSNHLKRLKALFKAFSFVFATIIFYRILCIKATFEVMCMKRKKFFRKQRYRHYNRCTKKNIFGIILIIVGLILILKVLPLNFWLFMFGVAILSLGIFLYKCS